MKKTKKIAFVLIILVGLLMSTTVSFATEDEKINEFTQEFRAYINAMEDQKNGIVVKNDEVIRTRNEIENPIRVLTMAETTLESKYTLQTVIPENVKIRNQLNTNLCWAFAELGSLESNLALYNKRNNLATKVYDFSEKHMAYATSREFLNGQINEYGFTKDIDSAGNNYISTAYLTNGIGAVSEAVMPFDGKSDKIELSKIQNNVVTSHVYDTMDFPITGVTNDEIKEYIKTYGGLTSMIYGASLVSDYYNNETGAIYCNDKTKTSQNHAVLIIGWDDNYDVNNFNEKNRPSKPGAWIVKNSWGTEYIYSTVDEFKTQLFNANQQFWTDKGINSPEQISEQELKTQAEYNGFTVRGDEIVIPKIGDNGYMYISYEDVWVTMGLHGITKASDKKDYENIYQYNLQGANANLNLLNSHVGYLANVFDRNTTTKTEYLTEVAVNIFETAKCSVYVNANGSSKAKNDLTPVKLVAGDYENLSPGYHTLEFLEPIELKGEQFTVVIKFEGNQENTYSFFVESKLQYSEDFPVHYYENIQTVTNKCFYTDATSFEQNNWQDLGTQACDSTIKAFTVSSIEKQDPESGGETNPPSTPTTVVPANFNNSNVVVETTNAYLYTKNTDDTYLKLEMKINNIKRSLENENVKYYYSLSNNPNETNITDWVLIKENQTAANSLSFIINTKDVPNMEKLVDADKVYVYVKEVITADSKETTTVSSGMEIIINQENVNFYVDDVLVKDFDINNNQSGNQNQSGEGTKEDSSSYNGILPQTGVRIGIAVTTVFVIILAVIFAKKIKKYTI